MFFRSRPPQYNVPIVRRVRELEIASARLIRAGFAGDYHAAFHGIGIEFAQVREYQPGDDVRAIDWNVTARSGVPHVKEFMEERDLTILIALDVSGSMGFGSADWRKCDTAAELTAVFAFAAVQNADRVGLLTFAENVRRYVPARRGRPHAQLVVRNAIESAMAAPRGTANLERAALYLERIARKRAVLIIISDFLEMNFERTLRRLDLRHDVIAVSISDPREERLPQRGLGWFVDAESGARRLVDFKAADLARRTAQRRQHAARRFTMAHVDLLEVSTTAPYDRDLIRFFRERLARRR